MITESQIRERYEAIEGVKLIEDPNGDWFISDQLQAAMKCGKSVADSWIQKQLKAGAIEKAMKVHEGKRRKCYRFVEVKAAKGRK